jgi:8-oxo-dGTP pyrophosphatase MutT (NUDIX family)
MREFKEETGLDVVIGPCVGSGVLTIGPPHLPCATDVWIQAYGCRLQRSPSGADRKLVISSEHKGWSWIPVADPSPNCTSFVADRLFRELPQVDRRSAQAAPAHVRRSHPPVGS